MARRIEQALGRSSPFIKVQPPAIISQRAPATTDTEYPKGQAWIDESVTPPILYWHIGGGDWNSNELSLSTDGTFAGALDTTASSSLAIKTYADNLAIAGAPDASTTVKGIAELATTAEAVAGTDTSRIMTPDNVASVFAAPPAVGSGTPAAGSFTTLAATGAINFDAGGSFESGGAAIDIGADASADAINVGTGAAARVITVGNVTGASQVVLNSGTAGIALASTGAGDITINSDDTLLLDADGVLEINSSAGVIGIGNDADGNNINIGTGAAARTITMGNGTGATSVVLNSGTGALNLGTNAVAHTVTIGNVTGASAVRINTGTGDFELEGNVASTYKISSTGANTGQIDIGGGTGAQTLNLMSGGTGVKTTNIGTGAIGNVLTIGSVTDASSLDLLCGTGNFSLEGNVASTYDISATGANTGTITVGGGTGAQTLNLMTGGTGIKTSNFGTGAIGNVITIGSVTGASSLDLLTGTGNFSLEGDVASTYEISSTGINTGTCKFASGTGARSIEIGGGGTGIKTIDIGAAATADVITVGTTTGAGSLALSAGTGGIVHAGKCTYTPDAITATSAGVAASVETVVTEITTNGDSDLDDVTLANGVNGQVKIFAVVAVGNAADSVKITPTSLIGGTQITFAANPLGLGCQMYYDAGAAGWIITGNNGGTVA